MKKLLCLILCMVLTSGLTGCLFRAEETSEEAYETIRDKEAWEGRYYVVIRMWQGRRRTVTSADDYLRLDRHGKAVFYVGSTVREGTWSVRNGELAVILGDGDDPGIGLVEDGQLGLTLGDNFYILVKGKSRAEETIALLLGQAAASSGPHGKEDLSDVPTRETPSVFSSLLVPTRNGTKPRTEPETTEEETTAAPETRPTSGSSAAQTQPETVRPTELETAARPTETVDPSWNEAQRLWNRGWYGFVTIRPGCTGVFSGAYREGEPGYGLSGRFSLDASGSGTYFFVDRTGALGTVGERLTGSCLGAASFLQILNGSAYGFSLRINDAVLRWNAADRTWRMELRYSGFMGKINATVVLRPWGETWEDTPYGPKINDYSVYLSQIGLSGDPLWN